MAFAYHRQREPPLPPPILLGRPRESWPIELTTQHRWRSDASSRVPLKQRIAEAVERTFGHDLVDATLPYEILLQRVRELLERVGPVLTIVDWIEHLRPDVQQFLEALPDNCQTISISRAKPTIN